MRSFTVLLNIPNMEKHDIFNIDHWRQTMIIQRKILIA